MSNKYFGTLWILLLAIGSSLFAQSTQTGIAHTLSIPVNLTSPVRVAIDKNDVIYTSDVATKSIKKYSVTGNYIGLIPFSGSPLSIAINSNNQVFVGDDQTGAISKIETDGTVAIFYAACQFPSSMVFGSDGNLYVADSKLREVVVISPSGNLVRSIGNGTLIFPTGIEFDSKNNKLYVAEHGGLGTGFNLHAEVKVFSIDGNYLSTIGSYGHGDGKLYRVQGIALNRCGSLFVIDSFQGQISLFSENGTFITKFGQFGSNAGNLNLPMDIVFDSQDHAIVSSLNNGTLELYDIQQTFPTSNIMLGNKSICAGESVDIPVYFTGNAPWSFTYTKDGSNSVSVSNTTQNPYLINTTEAGEYLVTNLSDANSVATCFTGKAGITVKVLPTSAMSNPAATICPGTSTQIPVEFTGSAPWNFTYTVDGFNPTQISNITETPYLLNVSDAGNYQITAMSDAHCTATSNTGIANISVNALPSSTIANQDAAICSGTSKNISINLTGVAPWVVTYTVDNANPVTFDNVVDNPFVLNVSNAGTYQVTSLSDATNSGTCLTGSATITVLEVPTANIITQASLICPGESKEISVDLLGTAPWSLTYVKDNEIPVLVDGISSSPYIFNVQQGGIYSVSAVADVRCAGLVLTDNVIITENNAATATLLTSNISICDGETADIAVSLTGIAPWTLTYNVNSTLFTVTNILDNMYHIQSTMAGDYSVTNIADATSSGSCFYGSTNVIKNAPVTSTIVSPTATICSGGSTEIQINFTGNGPWTMTYTKNNANEVTVSEIFNNPFFLPVSQAGNYQVVAINDAACLGSLNSGAALVNVEIVPVSSFTFNSTNLDVSFTTTTPNVVSVLWNFGDGTTSTELNPMHVFPASGSYLVTLTVTDQCETNAHTETLNLFAVNASILSIENTISFFPNPAKDAFYIQFSASKEKSFVVEIASITGQTVLSRSINAKNAHEKIDVSLLARGVYALKIISDEFNQTGKLILIDK